MTREEAIYRLKNMAWLYGSAEREQNIEAIDMAIEALSAESVSREEYEEVKEEYINTVGAILAVISAPSCLKEVNDLIEPLKLVRCKDCIRNNDGNLCDIAYYINEDGDGFCNCGERMKGGDDD